MTEPEDMTEPKDYTTKELQAALCEPIVLAQDVLSGSLVRRSDTGELMQVMTHADGHVRLEGSDPPSHYIVRGSSAVLLVAGPIGYFSELSSTSGTMVYKNQLINVSTPWLHLYKRGWRTRFVDVRTLRRRFMALTSMPFARRRPHCLVTRRLAKVGWKSIVMLRRGGMKG